MLKRVLLIDDPLTTLGALIWIGDEGQGRPKRRAALSGS